MLQACRYHSGAHCLLRMRKENRFSQFSAGKMPILRRTYSSSRNCPEARTPGGRTVGITESTKHARCTESTGRLIIIGASHTR